jgi:hypothetical protein
MQQRLLGATNDILRRMPPPTTVVDRFNDNDYIFLPKAIVDEIHRSFESYTGFGRRIARGVYKSKEDYYLICRKKSPTRLEWIRKLVRDRYPPGSNENEFARWSKCRNAIDNMSYQFRELMVTRDYFYNDVTFEFCLQPLIVDQTAALNLTVPRRTSTPNPTEVVIS